MGFLDGVLGRRKPVKPDLDQLFALPSAALTLQASLDFQTTGVGSVAFRAPRGVAFDEVQSEIQSLLNVGGGPQVRTMTDEFGFTWLVVNREASDLPGLVTDLHAINASLKDSGFGSTLLCSLCTFSAPDGQLLGLVYLFKQGTFYPFAPRIGAKDQRNNILELQVRDLLTGELRMEPDLARWFALWGAPGLHG